MSEHPIEGLMNTAMNSIKDMVDVNTIIGEPIETSNNIIIIPISKVGFGFAAGGSEFKGETINEYTKKDKDEEIQYKLPFGGGSGAGVSISPVAFLVVQGNNVKLLPVNHSSAVDKLLDYVPDLVERANNLINREMTNKKEEKKQEEQRKRQQEKKEEKEKQEKQEIIENHYTQPSIESNTIIVPNTTKLRPKRGKIAKYEYEYDETTPEDKIEDYDD